MQKATTNIDVKRINRRSVLRYVYEQRTTSRQEIASALQISMPTVLQNVKELQEMGLVRESGQYASTGGRKALRIESVPETHCAVGVDITRHHLAMVLVDLDGSIIAQRRIRYVYENTDTYYRGVGEAVEVFVTEQQMDTERILGVGISLPGIVNLNQSLLTDSHVLNVRNLPTADIQRYIPYPCQFLNDANAAGFSEVFGENSEKSILYLSLSNSVGGAVFINGKLFMGANCRCGEFGHMRLISGGKTCYCGQQGCVDAYCSSLCLTSLNDETLERYFECLMRKDEKHVRHWEVYLDHLALTIINLQMFFDSDVVLGGYVGAYLRPWMDSLMHRIAKLDPFAPEINDLRVGRYQYEAAAYGAATRWIEEFFNEF